MCKHNAISSQPKLRSHEIFQLQLLFITVAGDDYSPSLVGPTRPTGYYF